MPCAVGQFKHTFRRDLTSRHFGKCSCQHLVYHMEMVVVQLGLELPGVLNQAVDDDEFVDVEVVVEHEPFAVVLPFGMWQLYVDGLLQLWQLPSELDMVHIF